MSIVISVEILSKSYQLDAINTSTFRGACNAGGQSSAACQTRISKLEKRIGATAWASTLGYR